MGKLDIIKKVVGEADVEPGYIIVQEIHDNKLTTNILLYIREKRDKNIPVDAVLRR